jgi:hypothetical protein
MKHKPNATVSKTKDAAKANQQATEQGAAPDRLQPYASFVPHSASGFRRRVSLSFCRRAQRE